MYTLCFVQCLICQYLMSDVVTKVAVQRWPTAEDVSVMGWGSTWHRVLEPASGSVELCEPHEEELVKHCTVACKPSGEKIQISIRKSHDHKRSQWPGFKTTTSASKFEKKARSGRRSIDPDLGSQHHESQALATYFGHEKRNKVPMSSVSCYDSLYRDSGRRD